MWPILLGLMLFQPRAEAIIVDRIVVVVEDQLVMASDVELEKTLSKLDEVQLAFWSNKTPLERLIDAAVVCERAEEVSLYQPHEAEVGGRVEVIRRSFRDRNAWVAFLGQWGMDEADLRQVLRRRMVVEAYLRRNISTDPKNRRKWLGEVDKLIDKMRVTMIIRRVEAQLK